ncbi:SMC-Scp complex subunit ScpB [Leucobacter sp. CSA2]|uniref:SMC-Scp complex subunit ScpB n=1 Tax=Leucobacter edaphi TaxID=2796472 RepID=A0A934UYS8_9MICO|nr:SMC-Scp complex subunit ScpB [Leucobacter edaphi]MBK0422792.1 SMC-Scp complex subunit ScpB [Leucobacter edaphi]
MTEFDQDADTLDATVEDTATAGAEAGHESPEAPVSPEAAALARARAEHSLEQQLEALLIVADEPLSAVTLATATDRPVAEVRRALARLVADFDGAGGADGADDPQRAGDADSSGRSGSPRGFELREVAGGYRFYVRESLDPVVADFVQQQSPSRLSQAALETLSVIAYRQPISRGAIASIRAVNVDSVVRTLLGRGLVTEVGHDPETGATLYGTSDALLGYLGIGDISELPPISPLLDDGSEGFEHEQL